MEKLLAAAAAAIAWSGPITAQATLAGSPAYTALSQDLSAFGTLGTAPGLIGEHGGGQLTSGYLATAPNQAALGGIPWLDPTIVPGPPVLFDVDPDKGPSAGGQLVEIVGFNLLTAGGMPPTVLFGTASTSVPATVQTQSATVLTVTTGPGVNGLGNSLGPSSVSVETAPLQLGTLVAAYTYTPGLSAPSPTSIGTDLAVTACAAPLSTVVLVLGVALAPQAGVPIPPFAGALELNPVSPAPVILDTLLVPLSGSAQSVQPVPDNPSLVGVTIGLQSVAITAVNPLAGAFTNRADVTFVP